MKKKYFIEVNIYDTDGNFDEILEQIKHFLLERDGVEVIDIIEINKKQ